MGDPVHFWDRSNRLGVRDSLSSALVSNRRLKTNSHRSGMRVLLLPPLLLLKVMDDGF
jgi:hypothetical protein